jgi:protein-S-isoprenylcysteine O-methyltransferase Ste14
VDSNPSTGLAARPLRSLNSMRVMSKVLGLWLTIGTLAATYWLLSEYAKGFYDPFKAAALLVLPGVAIASPFYIAYVDVRQVDPVDAYAQIGMLLGGTKPDKWDDLALHARTWIVKGFFLPLMFVFANNGLVGLWAKSPPTAWNDFPAVFGWGIDLFYLLDVYLAAIAYTLTLRVLDSHVRSVDTTLGGWLVCLICYQPISEAVGGSYLNYDADQLYWGAVFGPYPALYVLWGGLILALVLVYLLSTVSFGLRFSNLTNRGIISTGPYQWVKHPAYLSKNLSWWMISVPFIAGAGWPTALRSCVLLLLVNLIYFLRAKTEERHLSADPAYRDYQAFIAEHGLVQRLRGLYQRHDLAETKS